MNDGNGALVQSKNKALRTKKFHYRSIDGATLRTLSYNFIFLYCRYILDESIHNWVIT